jgi:hypothetical protein
VGGGVIVAIAAAALGIAAGIYAVAFHLGRLTGNIEAKLVKQAEDSDRMNRYWHREVCDQAEYLKKVKPILQEHGYLDYHTWKYGPEEAGK